MGQLWIQLALFIDDTKTQWDNMYSMNIFIRSLIFVTTFLIINIFGFMNVQASANANYNISSGVDNSDGLSDAFLPAENIRLGSSDNDRVQSNGNWPVGNYDESKYIEFVFSPSVPSGAIIESASISHEYYESVKLTAAKLEVWNGTSFVDYPINLPVTSGSANEISETVNIFNTISTANQVNGLKVRFLAFRETIASSIKTSHDLMVLNVTYSMPEVLPPVVVDPEPSPQPEIIPEPIPETIPDPAPAPDPVPEPHPAPTPEPDPLPVVSPDPVPVVVPDPAPEIPTPDPVAPNTNQENVVNNNGAVPLFALGSSVNPEIKTIDVNAAPEIPKPEITPEITTSSADPVVTEDSVPVSAPKEDFPIIETFDKNPEPSESNLPEEPEIDPSLSLAAAGTASSGDLGNSNWWILLLFAILGSYLAIRIRQKPKSQKL